MIDGGWGGVAAGRVLSPEQDVAMDTVLSIPSSRPSLLGCVPGRTCLPALGPSWLWGCVLNMKWFLQVLSRTRSPCRCKVFFEKAPEICLEIPMSLELGPERKESDHR